MLKRAEGCARARDSKCKWSCREEVRVRGGWGRGAVTAAMLTAHHGQAKSTAAVMCTAGGGGGGCAACISLGFCGVGTQRLARCGVLAQDVTVLSNNAGGSVASAQRSRRRRR